MRKILLTSLLIWFFGACQNDDSSFGVTVSDKNLSFRPVAGGAIMRYVLPDNDHVQAILVRYQDAFGKDVLCSGSYACDSLQLIGFNEARQGVRAYVSLCDQNEVESDPIEVTFDTKDSGPVAFFKQLEVRPSWNGFMITYNVPEQANGMAHVFYVGEDPLSHKPDTILVSSFAFTGGADTLTFSLKQSNSTNDVVIKTEDFRGYVVKQEVWQGIEIYNSTKLDPSKFDFEDSEKISVEDPDNRLGYQYLFDGDTKGAISFLTDKNIFNMYLAGPGIIGRPMGIIDLRESKMVSNVNLYAMLKVKKTWPFLESLYNIFGWNGEKLEVMSPCSVTIYGSNDKSSWKKMGTYEQYNEIAKTSRWCYRAFSKTYGTMAEINAEEPCRIEVMFPATGETFRYLKIVINDLYKDTAPTFPVTNKNEYMVLQELEVYTSED